MRAMNAQKNQKRPYMPPTHAGETVNKTGVYVVTPNVLTVTNNS